MKNHYLDKPILRHLFWFIVLPYRLKQWQQKEYYDIAMRAVDIANRAIDALENL